MINKLSKKFSIPYRRHSDTGNYEADISNEIGRGL